MPQIADFVTEWLASPFGEDETTAWRATSNAPELLRRSLARLEGDFIVEGECARHITATVEAGAVIKGPAVIGPNAFVSSSAFLRGGVYLGRNCIIGPGCEIKTCFLFTGSKVAHLSFVGDSILGGDVNVEAGAIIANFRNEMHDKTIRIAFQGETINTGVDKFGALVGDGSRIGANAVIAPGALLPRGACIGRLQLVDQHPAASAGGAQSFWL